MDQKDLIIQELHNIIYKYGVKALMEFESRFPCDQLSCVKVPYNHIPNNSKFIERNFGYGIFVWQGISYNDAYLFRIQSYEKFWIDWNQFKRYLELLAFT